MKTKYVCKIIANVSVVALIFFLCASDSHSATRTVVPLEKIQQLKTYTDAYLNLTVSYPSAWKIRKKGVAVKIMAPSGGFLDLYNEGIIILATDLISKPLTLDAYQKLTEQDILKKLNRVKILDRGKTTINGKLSVWFTYSYLKKMGNIPFGSFIPRSTAIKRKAYLFLSGSVGYIVVCTAGEEDFAKYDEQFNKIIHTIKILKNQGSLPAKLSKTEYKTYKNDIFNYSFKTPADWQIEREDPTKGLVSVMSPRTNIKNSDRINITVTMENVFGKVANIYGIKDAVIEMMEKRFSGIGEISQLAQSAIGAKMSNFQVIDEENIMINREKGIIVTAMYNLNNVKMRTRVYIVDINSLMITIAYTTSRTQFDKYLPLASDIVNSFQINRKAGI